MAESTHHYTRVTTITIGLCAACLVGCASVEEQQAFEAWSIIDPAGLDHQSTTDVPNRAPRAVLAPDATLDDYLAHAALHNPGLEAAFHQWKAALEQIPQARSLPDPRFSYRYFIENVETRVGPQRQAIGFSQMFPWFEKLTLRGGMAVEAARAAQAQYEARKQRLFYDVKQAYHAYYYLGRSVAVVRENRELVVYLEEVARTRFKAATAGHPDVIRAQVELGKLDDRLRSLEDLQAPTVAQLNALLNRPVDAALPWPTDLPEDAVTIDDPQLLDRLAKRNPELIAMQHQIAQQRRGIGLARKGTYPDVTLRVDYIDTGAAVMPGVSDSGNDPVSVGVSLNLPLWPEKYDAAVGEALAKFSAATKMRVDRHNALQADLKAALYAYHDAQRKINLYRDTLVPKALQAIKATEAAFRAGTASFIDLIDAQRVLLEFQLAYERALTDRANCVAQIQMLIGGDLSLLTATDHAPAPGDPQP